MTMNVGGLKGRQAFRL